VYYLRNDPLQFVRFLKDGVVLGAEIAFVAYDAQAEENLLQFTQGD